MNPSGAVSGRFWWVIYAANLLIFSYALSSCVSIVSASPPPTVTPAPPDGNISVTVIGADGKSLVHGVVVRVAGTAQSDSDDHGALKLTSCATGQYIAVWAPNYQVSFIPCDSSTVAYSVQLQPLNNVFDNPNYSWLSAYGNCSQCHASQLNASYNEFPEWESSAHARVFADPYFQTMYRGTDISGVSGPPTQWQFVSGKLVRRVDPASSAYKGPGFQLDYPGQAGNCADCHAPAAILASRADVDLTSLFLTNNDMRKEGVTCDVCHKVTGVIFADNKYPFPDKPGILSFQMLKMDAFTTGPFSNVIVPNLDLVNYSRSMCSSIFSSSDFCAACHYGKFGDVVIYNSYGEWKTSSYAKNPSSDKYKTCQDCHMSRTQNAVESNACGETPPKGTQDFTHNLMDFGRDDKLGRELPRLIRGAADLNADFEFTPAESNLLKVHVTVKNTKAGHKFPTDSPLRHLILYLDGRDQFGNTLLQVDGPQIPNWGGISNSYMESRGVRGYAGLPGKIFANLLIEEDINLWPSAAYWNETKPAFVQKKDVVSDNRLEPNGKDESFYFFTVPDDGEVRFTISLMYRFGFYDLMQQKRWTDTGQRADIPVTVIECDGNVNAPEQIVCNQIDP